MLGAGEALLERAEATPEPAEEGLRERTTSRLRRRLGETALEKALVEGRVLGAQEAVELALQAKDPVDRDAVAG